MSWNPSLADGKLTAKTLSNKPGTVKEENQEGLL